MKKNDRGRKKADRVKDDKELDAYCAAYMDFLAKGKTERTCYAEAVRLLEACGFKSLDTVTTFKPGDRIYRGYHGKTLFAAVAGKAPVAEGIRVVGGHTDAPRLDLKPHALYEKDGITYFDTHMYGGIKKYQWLAMPLALYGTVVKKDGTRVDIAIGDQPGDPVFMISDILPHFGKDQLDKPTRDAVAAEDMDVIAGLGPIDERLKKAYGLEKDDLLSAELEIVPAGAPREVGLDRAFIAAYGHDDRVCAYAGLSALLDLAFARESAVAHHEAEGEQQHHQDSRRADEGGEYQNGTVGAQRRDYRLVGKGEAHDEIVARAAGAVEHPGGGGGGLAK